MFEKLPVSIAAIESFGLPSFLIKQLKVSFSTKKGPNIISTFR